MTYGAKTKTNEAVRSHNKRTSPHKDRTRKPKAAQTEKKGQCKVDNVPQSPNTQAKLLVTEEEELLTPESILKSYHVNKTSSVEPMAPQTTALPKEKATQDKSNDTNGGILELLSKKDNLEKIANSVTKIAENKSAPIEVPSKQPSSKNTPCTPPKKCSSPERFAGLSNSPAPNALPLPSFSFIDQELSKGATKDVPSPDVPTLLRKAVTAPSILIPQHPISPLPNTLTTVTPQPTRSLTFGHGITMNVPLPITPQPAKSRNPAHNNRKFHSAEFKPTPPASASLPVPVQPPTRALNHSPPSNPHLDELSSQLRMMLNIAPM